MVHLETTTGNLTNQSALVKRRRGLWDMEKVVGGVQSARVPTDTDPKDIQSNEGCSINFPVAVKYTFAKPGDI